MANKNGWGEETEGTVQFRGEMCGKRSDVDRWDDKTSIYTRAEGGWEKL